MPATKESKGSTLSDYQLKLMIATALESKEIALCETFEEMADFMFTECAKFKPPFGISETRKIKERVPVVAVSSHKKGKSKLVEYLKDNYEEVCLVADSILPSKESLHFATLTSDRGKMFEWVKCMNQKNIEVFGLSLDSDFLIITPFSSFVH